MYSLNIQNRELGPYEAIWYPDGRKEGNMLPLLYDVATISLKDEKKSFVLCFKKSSSLFGGAIQYADVVDMASGEFFSLQASNIFHFSVENGDPKVIIKIGKELKFYEDFWKKELVVEPDGEKTDLTPLGYFDTFVGIDPVDGLYIPIILSEEKKRLVNVPKFSDYYGFRSYETEGIQHFLLFVEDQNSTEEAPDWYWTDNFIRISERIDLPLEEYVEEWNIDRYGNIYFTVTSGKKYHIDKGNGKMLDGWNLPVSSDFTFVRVYEDTDSNWIVAKNDKWFFIVDATKTNITKTEQEAIVTYSDFIWCLSPSEASKNEPYFLMLTPSEQIVLIDVRGKEVAGTDLTVADVIITATMNTSSLAVTLESGETRVFGL